MELTRTKRDWPVVAREGSVAIGAVRKVGRDVVEVYIEGYGDVALRAAQITAAHDAKVVLALEARPDLSTTNRAGMLMGICLSRRGARP